MKHPPISSRASIRTVLLVMLAVLGGWGLVASLQHALDGWRNYERSREISERARLAGHLLTAARHLASERGRTAVVLCSVGPISDGNRAFIDERRRLADASMGSALEGAGALPQAVHSELRDRWREIGRLRQGIDRDTALPLVSCDSRLIDRWFDATSGAIGSIHRSVEGLAGESPSGGGATRLMLLAAAVLELRLTAGSEADGIAQALASPKAPEAEILYAIHEMRGQEAHIWHEIERLAAAVKIGALQEKIQAVKQHHLDVFRPLQNQGLSDLAAPGRTRIPLGSLAAAPLPALDEMSGLMILAGQQAVHMAAQGEAKARTSLLAYGAWSASILFLLVLSFRYVLRHVVAPLEQIDRMLRRGNVLPVGDATRNEIERLKASAAAMELLEHAIDQSSDAVLLIDEELHFNYVNDAACRSLGYSRAELLSLTPVDINPDVDRDAVLAMMKRILVGERHVFESRHRRKDGSIFPVEISASLARHGGVRFSLALVRDITERRQMEAMLTMRERDFRSLAENLPDNIARWDAEGRYLYINPTHERTLGVVAGDVIGTFIPDAHEHVKAAIAQVAATGLAVSLVRQPVPVDGQIEIHEVNLVPEFDEAGRVVSVLGIGRDMTDIHRMQEAIAAREQEFRSLAESSPDSIIRYDLDHRILYLNSGPVRALKLPSADEVIGRLPIEVWPDGRFAVIDEAAKRAIMTGNTEIAELVWAPGDPGQFVVGQIYVVPERDIAGNIIGTIAFGRDITERKRMENELRHQADFQGTLLNALNDVGIQLMMIENGRIIHVGNRELARRFGYTDADLDAHPALVDIVHPDDRARVMDYYLRRLAGEPGPGSYELGLVTREGERREYETAVAIVPGTDPIRTVTIGKDITERKTMEDALRRSRESLAEAQRIALVGSWELDLVSNSLSWSDEIFRIFEIDPQQFGASYEAFVNAIHPDDRDAVNRAYTESLENRTPYAIEHRVLMADGRVKYVHERCETHYAADGMPLRSLGTVQDITERKLAEAILESERSRLRAFLNTIPDLVWIKDPDGIYLACNPTFEDFFGAPEADIVGKSDFDFVDAELAAFFHQKDLEAMAVGCPSVNEEWVTFASDGRRVLLETIKTPVCNAQGGIEGVLSVARDITRRKRMEAALATREREFRTLAENSPDSIVRYDHGCRFVYVNPTFEKLLGFRLDDLHGKTPTEVPGLPKAEFFQKRVEEVVVTGVADEFEHAVQTADGTAVWSLVSIFPERDETGQVAYVQVLSRDITALKDAQRHLEASRARLRELAVLQNSEQEAERKQLAWDVHEGIGQYLMALRMNLSMLSRQSGCQERIPASCEHIRNMFEIVGKSIQLVREVTEGLRPSVLDSGIVAALEWLGEKFMEDTGIPCELSLPDEDLPMDERAGTMIFRVAEEALANVVQHANPGVVELTLTQRGGNCYLAVRDDGNGFDLTRLYDNSVAGLAWLQEQIVSLGGEINVFSVPGQGTMIEAIVPIRDISEEQ
jgi:PAS domain S-box-containing protein